MGLLTEKKTSVLKQPNASTKKSRKLPTLKSPLSAKIADIEGAVRILTSKETILLYSPDTASRLRKKHLNAHPKSQHPADPHAEDTCFKTNKEKLLKALRSFKKGTGGGPNGLLLHHLLDMSGDTLDETASKLIDTLQINTSVVHP